MHDQTESFGGRKVSDFGVVHNQYQGASDRATRTIYFKRDFIFQQSFQSPQVDYLFLARF
jgi:hypothetical protein